MPAPPSTQRISPRIAVIVPAYGVAHLVGAALVSLQAQTVADWECIVIDDGAPDNVASAVAPFLNDPRIRFIQTANHGVSAARNRAIAETRAPAIALLDGDDLLRPAYLEKMLAALDSDPEARLVTCNARIFGAVAHEYEAVSAYQGSGDGVRGSLGDVIDRSFSVYIGSIFHRTDFEMIGGFDSGMTHSEDFDLWVRLLMLGGHALYVDEVLGDYRVRAASASASSLRMLLGNIRVYEKALVKLHGYSEEAVLRRMIAVNRQLLAIEHAIDRVIDGDTRSGIGELRDIGAMTGWRWRAAFAAWRIVPALARPMLRWRQQAHSRGNVRAFSGFTNHDAASK